MACAPDLDRRQGAAFVHSLTMSSMTSELVAICDQFILFLLRELEHEILGGIDFCFV
jgi:hypothetical protein